MNTEQLIDQLRADASFRSCVTAWKVLQPRPASYSSFPDYLHPDLVSILRQRGIGELYTHQGEALEAVARGEDVVVVTPTASGKTLCYNLPVLNHLLHEPDARALYLFPAKALAQDQRAELHLLVELLGRDIKTHTYDGDTPVSARQAIRKAGHIVITNPDMLHTGILPHHTKWMKLFKNLRYVIIDELHQYRGVFGSHVANVIRRLHRVCRFYGSHPTFIASSATIGNPLELARRLTGRELTLVNRSGAPAGEKHFIFYNPPVVNKQLGIRRSCLLEAQRIGRNFLSNGIPTIVFARTRLSVEILVTYLRRALHNLLPENDAIRGYRGGYLPTERRSIERGLREGTVRGVVSTNALELGIDIGTLEAAVMTGYPGTIASTWQQAGRAGRGQSVSAAVLVASSSPLDQYIINHPEYFFDKSPELGLIHPDNLYVLLSHIKCAAFELPFEDGELFGVETTQDILEFLEERGVLRHVGQRWHWMAEHFPAEDVSLRSAAQDNFVIIDRTNGARVIGEVDRFSAPLLIHDEAIYLHESQQHQVEELDYDEKKAYVKQVDVDYYTDANLAVTIKPLDVFEEAAAGGTSRAHGEVLLTAKATIFKKIKFHTHENVGWGKIHLPEEQMHTTAYWFTLDPAATASYSEPEVEAGLQGISNVMRNVAPLHLMCDPRDIGAVAQVRSPFTHKPTVYIYDSMPGGVGFGEKLFGLHLELAAAAYEVVAQCSCSRGCPSCVGPLEEVGPLGKPMALSLLEEVLGDRGPAQTAQ